MSTKEEIKTKARHARETGQVILRWPALVRTAEYLIRMLLGCMLAGAEIFGSYAPFGWGWQRLRDREWWAFLPWWRLLRYIAFRGFVGGLPYVAACILTFSVSFAFYDVKLYRHRWFMPVVAALLGGVTGFVYLSDQLSEVTQAVFFATELLLIAASAYFYRMALSPWDKKREETELTARQTVSLFVLGCTLLISLAGVNLPGALSLGCLAGALISMIAAWKGGAGVGAAVGVCTGLAMDLALGQAPQGTPWLRLFRPADRGVLEARQAFCRPDPMYWRTV